MRAVILAGGLGMRMRPYTAVLPKPLLPVGDRPILELIMRQLWRAGFREFDLCIGHLGGLLRSYIESGADLPSDITVRYHWEKKALGTAGALRVVPVSDEPFLVMNGDILTDLDYADFFAFHRKQEAALSIATYNKEVKLSLGVIEGDGAKVTGYIEKPTLDYRVSMGVYMYSPQAVELIPEGHFDFPDVVVKAVDAGMPVSSYPFEGNWFDIGTTAEYERAVEALRDSDLDFDTRL